MYTTSNRLPSIYQYNKKIPATMMFQWTYTLNVSYKFSFHIPHYGLTILKNLTFQIQWIKTHPDFMSFSLMAICQNNNVILNIF